MKGHVGPTCSLFAIHGAGTPTRDRSPAGCKIRKTHHILPPKASVIDLISVGTQNKNPHHTSSDLQDDSTCKALIGLCCQGKKPYVTHNKLNTFSAVNEHSVTDVCALMRFSDRTVLHLTL